MNTRGILLVALLICGPSYVEAASWKRADVYYLPWELEVRARLSPERVRALASTNPPLMICRIGQRKNAAKKTAVRPKTRRANEAMFSCYGR